MGTCHIPVLAQHAGCRWLPLPACSTLQNFLPSHDHNIPGLPAARHRGRLVACCCAMLTIVFLLQVPHPELQHNIMIEAVENHMPVRLFCLLHSVESQTCAAYFAVAKQEDEGGADRDPFLDANFACVVYITLLAWMSWLCRSMELSACAVRVLQEVIVIDEIGTEAECLAARTIAQRGVQLIATAHGQELANVIQNPSLQDLLGGVQK